MEIRVGDRVVTNLGQCGVVDMICNCEECKKRGFDEPQIKFEDGSYGYITDNDKRSEFSRYFQIGNNRWPEHVVLQDVQDMVNDQYQKISEATFVIKRAEGLINTLRSMK